MRRRSHSHVLGGAAVAWFLLETIGIAVAGQRGSLICSVASSAVVLAGLFAAQGKNGKNGHA